MDVNHIAKLSQLTLDDDESSLIESQLNSTINYIENLSELDTSKLEPRMHVNETYNIFFEDGTDNHRHLTQTQATENAPAIESNSFVVNKII